MIAKPVTTEPAMDGDSMVIFDAKGNWIGNIRNEHADEILAAINGKTWIPCSEGLPDQVSEKQVKCLVTVEWEIDGTRDVGITGYFAKEGWAVEVAVPGRLKGKVIAWQPLQTPYVEITQKDSEKPKIDFGLGDGVNDAFNREFPNVRTLADCNRLEKDGEL